MLNHPAHSDQGRQTGLRCDARTSSSSSRHGVQKATYPRFRESIFYDSTLNHVLKHEGSEPDPMSCVRESRRLWTTNGPKISDRVPKTAVAPGTAFRNECLSADQLYSTNTYSLGYDAHRKVETQLVLLELELTCIVVSCHDSRRFSSRHKSLQHQQAISKCMSPWFLDFVATCGR